MTMAALNLRLLLHLKLLDGTLYPVFKSCSVTGGTRILNNQILTCQRLHDRWIHQLSKVTRSLDSSVCVESLLFS